MNKLFASIVCFSLSALIAAAAGEKKNGPKLEGSWTATAGIIDGKKLPEEEIAKIKLVVTIKEGKYSVSIMGKEIEAGTYKLDATKKPAAIDLTIGKGKDEGKTQLGIYQLDGDQLTVAIAGAGVKNRPKDFDGAESVEVTTLKRNK